MPRVRTAVAAACLFLCAGVLPAQPTAPEDRNAALKYWSAWSALTPEAIEKAAGFDWAEYDAREDAAWRAGALERAARTIPPGFVESIMSASRLDKCDFEVEIEKGFDTLMPHLAKARQAARIIRVDIRHHLAQDDASGAADRIATLYRMAGHTANDSILISGLVASAIGAMANGEAEHMITEGKLTAAARDTILGAIAGMDAGDPFGVKRGILGEQEIGPRWIKMTFTGDDAGQKFANYFATGAGQAPTIPEWVRLMQGQGLAKVVDQLSGFYDEVLAAWDAPDAAARIAAIDASLEQGKYGPLAKLLAPAVSRAHENYLKSKAELARIVELLNNAKVKG